MKKINKNIICDILFVLIILVYKIIVSKNNVFIISPILFIMIILIMRQKEPKHNINLPIEEFNFIFEKNLEERLDEILKYETVEEYDNFIIEFYKLRKLYYTSKVIIAKSNKLDDELVKKINKEIDDYKTFLDKNYKASKNFRIIILIFCKGYNEKIFDKLKSEVLKESEMRSGYSAVVSPIIICGDKMRIARVENVSRREYILIMSEIRKIKKDLQFKRVS